MTPPPAERPHRPAFGISFCCLGACLFTVQDAAVKWLTTDYSIPQIIFLRCFLALLISVWWARVDGGIRVGSPRLLLLSVCTNISAWFCFYTGLSALPLTVAICVFFLTPVAIAVLSIPLLDERPTWRQGVALLSGLGGVFIITNPLAAAQAVSLAAIGWILLSVVFWSLTAVLTRALESSTTVGATLVYHNTGFLLVGIILQPFYWQTPALPAFAGMILLGALSVCAQACLVISYRSARAAVVATAEYSALVWAALFGWLLWDERFGARELVGVALIITAGVIVSGLGQRKRGKEAAARGG